MLETGTTETIQSRQEKEKIMGESWITKQANCRPQQTFLALVELLRKDIEEYNGLPDEQRSGGKYSLDSINKDQTAISIYFLAPGSPNTSVAKLHLIGDAINVAYDKYNRGDIIPPLNLTITVKWDKERQDCIYSLEQKGQNPWESGLPEVSRSILQPLFFVS